MSDIVWRPIQPLSEHERNIDLAAMRPLYEHGKRPKTAYGNPVRQA